MEHSVRGSCLCGAVAFTVRPPLRAFRYCHCSRCRKTSGSAHAANFTVEQEQLAWSRGEDHVGRFELPGARAYASCFCKTCGLRLPWTAQNSRWVIVPAGALDDDPGVRPERNIYWGSRAPCYEPVGGLPTFDTRPPRKR